jgi:cytosine/adenosine deaminase-related metal-dependent hydrolase
VPEESHPDLMIIRARVVVTMDGPPIENGAVAISGGRITDVGVIGEIKARNSGAVVDLGERALLPGLINAHCHLDYTGLRGKIPSSKSFTEWIRSINAEKEKHSEEDYRTAIQQGLAEARKFGTTTVVNFEAFPELISTILKPMRVWWFAELIDVRDPKRASEMVDAALAALGNAEHRGLAPHALFTASAAMYRRCEEIGQRDKIVLSTHLAESREEMLMFCEGRGALYEFLKSIGRDMSDCGGTTPLASFLGRTRGYAGSVVWLVAHLNELTADDFALPKTSVHNFHVAHCPRSHNYFGHSPFQFQKLQSLGVNICLGTDSLASNEDLSLFGEMRAFQKAFPKVSSQDILSMVTRNPALALGKLHELGSIRPGSHADLIALPVRGPTLYDEIISLEDAVPWSMVGGEAAEA